LLEQIGAGKKILMNYKENKKVLAKKNWGDKRVHKLGRGKVQFSVGAV
jgi:hypothetical protein